ncbi:assimilatory nitrate reductase catalytic subunit/cobaltochelatase CobN [Rhizobium sp. NFR07]|nr:assimilatory nitrate reductase catalytic subunit/cobaltochelatase CobN [Rhizobium sp. NFR07]
MGMRSRQTTPLWPAGHLPHKQGDQLGVRFRPNQAACTTAPQHPGLMLKRSLAAKSRPLVISPLVGEMAGRPEGGWQGTTEAIGEASP